MGGEITQTGITVDLLVDGTFGNGVSSWQSMGTVPDVTGEVIIWDSHYPAGLWQPVATGDAISLTLTFSIRYDLISNTFETGTFPDFFVATLEFAEDPALFGIYGGGVEAITLGSVDALSGLRGLAEGVVVQYDPLETEWQQITFVTEPLGNYVTPFFRLFDENSIAGDSRIIISDVSLTAEIIPETNAFAMLLGLVALGCVLIKRLKIPT